MSNGWDVKGLMPPLVPLAPFTSIQSTAVAVDVDVVRLAEWNTITVYVNRLTAHAIDIGDWTVRIAFRSDSRIREPSNQSWCFGRVHVPG